MKYAISNIAWKPSEKEAVYALMNEYGFTGLEVAPSLLMGGSEMPYEESEAKCLRAKKEVEAHGLQLVSMQSLLFGASGLALFSGQDSRQALIEYCKKAVDFAAFVEIPNLVFGSPKNRIIPDDMSGGEVQNVAISFFRELGDYAIAKNSCIAMEANAKAYGGNFITQTLQAIELIEKVNSNGFKLNLDMGTMSLENESDDIINAALPYTNHIHISEGFLAPVYEGDEGVHKNRAAIIKVASYDGYVSIEMKCVSESDNLQHVEKAMDFVRRTYG